MLSSSHKANPQTSPPSMKLNTLAESLAPANRTRAHKMSGYTRRALGTDLAMLALAMLVVAAVSPTGGPSGTVPSEPLVWVLGFSALVVGLFALQGMYVPPMRLDALDAIRVVVSQTALAAIAVMAARIIVTNDTWVAAQTIRHWIPAAFLLGMGRLAVLWWESRARRQGEAVRLTLIVGAGKIGRLAAARLLAEPELGVRPVAFLDDAPLEGDEATADLPVLPLEADLEAVVNEFGISHVIIAFSMTRHEDLLRLSRRASELGLTISMVPRLFELEGERVATSHLGGLPLVGIRHTDPRGWQIRVKYALDRVLSAVALLLLLPLLAVIAIAVRLSLGRPVLFRQRRVGLDGREFDMLKFRTLPQLPPGGEADAEWAARQLGGKAIATPASKDKRLTRVGRLLRRYSLDELPQLWNVLRGDMSLIGPRPERVAYAQHFHDAVYRYGDRHRLKCGLTGWAQIHGLRGETPLMERVEWDNHYIENWTLWMDFKIMVRTIPVMLRGTHE
jgi:exopolysaccharide biosynthesis polyprenyl glycosylphosphotransferase